MKAQRHVKIHVNNLVSDKEGGACERDKMKGGLDAKDG